LNNYEARISIHIIYDNIENDICEKHKIVERKQVFTNLNITISQVQSRFRYDDKERLLEFIGKEDAYAKCRPGNQLERDLMRESTARFVEARCLIIAR